MATISLGHASLNAVAPSVSSWEEHLSKQQQQQQQLRDASGGRGSGSRLPPRHRGAGGAGGAATTTTTPYNCGTCGKVNRFGDTDKFICPDCGGRIMFKRPLEYNPFKPRLLAR